MRKVFAFSSSSFFFVFLLLFFFSDYKSYLNSATRNLFLIRNVRDLEHFIQRSISFTNLNSFRTEEDTKDASHGLLSVKIIFRPTNMNESIEFIERSAVSLYAKSIYLSSPLSNFQPILQDYHAISLKEIVDETLKSLNQNGIPVNNISISLLDLTSQNCCDYYGFQDRERRYPASLAKLFWVAMLKDLQVSSSSQLNTESLANFTTEDERKILYESDNNSASKVLDVISRTVSSKNPLTEDQLMNWVKGRMSINDYFHERGYTDINLTQKTFPIPSLDIYEPVGPDLQLREVLIDVQNPPQRNYLTSFDVTKLLLEIAKGKLVSEEVSFQMKQNLLQEHRSEDIRKAPYNPIMGFFGEQLPDNARIFTKVGFTESDGRQEAAIIESNDQEIQFILVVFANESFFSQEDSTTLPLIANLIYSQMSLRRKAINVPRG